MGIAKRYSRRYVTFVRVVVAQDQRHLLTIAKTVMKLTKTRKHSVNEDENIARRNQIKAKTSFEFWSIAQFKLIIFINSQ